MILEEAFELVGGVERVVEHDCGAQLEDGVERGDGLRGVGGDDGDAVALADAEGTQARGGAAHLTVELRVGLGLTEEVGGRLVRIDGQVVVVDVQQRCVAVVEGVRRPLGVVLEPGFGLISRHKMTFRLRRF